MTNAPTQRTNGVHPPGHTERRTASFGTSDIEAC